MNKLTFYDYFPKSVGRPPITEINILRYLSRYGKTRRAKIATDFDKHNQEINDAIKKLTKLELVRNYCELCKVEIKDYSLWDKHKDAKKHRDYLKEERKNETIEKSKPVIMITKKGLEIAIEDPMENREYRILEKDVMVKKPWRVITTNQFWDILTEIFQNSKDFDNLEYLCEKYEVKILEIFKENMSPQYFKNCLKEFKEYNNDLFQLQDIKKEEAFFQNAILKIIAYNESLSCSKEQIIEQIKKSYKVNLDSLDKHFKKMLSKGIIESKIKNNQERFQITHLGLVLLLHFLSTDIIFFTKSPPEFQKIIESIRTPDKAKIDLFHNDFKKVQKKYSYLLPLILEDENFHKTNLSIIGFLKIFDEMYFSKTSVLGEHNFKNFRKFYEIRDEDFSKKFDNYVTSFTLSKVPFDEIYKKNIQNRDHSKKGIERLNKILEEEVKYRKNLVYLKNTVDRKWTIYYPADMLFERLHDEEEKYNPAYIKLINKFQSQIITSMENRITFDFYSVLGQNNADFGVTLNNNIVEEWYVAQLEQLSKYVSHYFEKIML